MPITNIGIKLSIQQRDFHNISIHLAFFRLACPRAAMRCLSAAPSLLRTYCAVLIQDGTRSRTVRVHEPRTVPTLFPGLFPVPDTPARPWSSGRSSDGRSPLRSLLRPRHACSLAFCLASILPTLCAPASTVAFSLLLRPLSRVPHLQRNQAGARLLRSATGCSGDRWYRYTAHHIFEN